MAATREDLLARLSALGIETNTIEHEAFMTVEEAKAARGAHDLAGAHFKTLFLKNKKKTLFLVVALEETQIDLKALSKQLGGGRLSFGNADLLYERLGVTPGSVTPFALINDGTGQVNVILDAPMMDHDRLHFHPLENTATTAIGPADLLRFIADCGHDPEIWDLARLE